MKPLPQVLHRCGRSPVFFGAIGIQLDRCCESDSDANAHPNGFACVLVNRFAGQMNDCMCHRRTGARRCVYAGGFAEGTRGKILGHNSYTDAVFRLCVFWRGGTNEKNKSSSSAPCSNEITSCALWDWNFLRNHDRIPRNDRASLHCGVLCAGPKRLSFWTFSRILCTRMAVHWCESVMFARNKSCMRNYFNASWKW